MTDAAAEARESAFNPWISMWLAPRRTVRRLLDTDPNRHVILLACLGGIGEGLARASARGLGDSYPLPVVIAIGIVGGVVGGLLSLYLWSILISWTGTWLKGRAAPREIRTVLAWASVPAVWALGLWIPEIAIFGEELFATEMPRVDESSTLTLALIGFGIVETVVVVWTFVLLARSIAEAQGFGAWKGFANLLIAIALFAGTIGLFVGGYFAFQAI